MTRGRKKDLTIPPTRALVQQRDYRARKAHYIAELEERVRTAEAENVQLRRDLEAARAGLNVPALSLSPQVAEASRELLQHLTLATSSLGRFQQLAFSDRTHPSVPLPLQLPPATDSPAPSRTVSFPSPAPSPPFSQATTRSPDRIVMQSLTTSLPSFSPPLPSASYPSGRKRLYREDSPEPLEPRHFVRNISPQSDSSKRSPSSESECCGGILDCRDLIEKEEDNEGDNQPPSRISVMRSTS